ncbi:MAG: hypothetical protein KatS3mg030_308 [Saprospiraceae bacterium]|nr:MAG: hypothetical protein KatS3mg030_308 [Saprospiraceae bacterium]
MVNKVALARLNKSINVEWCKTFDVKDGMEPYSVDNNSQGNIVVSVKGGEAVGLKSWLLYFQNDGSISWSVEVEVLGDILTAILTDDNKVLLCIKDRVAFVDQDQNLLWSKKVVLDPYAEVSITDYLPVESGDSFIISLRTHDVNNYLVKLSNDGSVLINSAPFPFTPNASTYYLINPARPKKFLLKAQSEVIGFIPYKHPALPQDVSLLQLSFNVDSLYTIKKNLLGVGKKAISYSLLHDNSIVLTLSELNIAKSDLFGELNCLEPMEIPPIFGQTIRTFETVSDTSSLFSPISLTIQDLHCDLSTIALPQYILECQTYYGPPLPDIVIDTFICLGAEIDLKYTHPTGTVVWEDGSMDSLFHVTEPGVYRATVHHCGTTQQVVFNVPDGKCPCVFEVPNAFTPNGDGINDSFGPVYQCYFADYRLRVFNRWGQEVFTSTDPAQGWDGRIDGKEAPSEVYMWHATYTAWHEGQLFSRSASGEVTLLR